MNTLLRVVPRKNSMHGIRNSQLHNGRVPDEVGATLNSIMSRHGSDTTGSCRNLPHEEAAVTMA